MVIAGTRIDSCHALYFLILNTISSCLCTRLLVCGCGCAHVPSERRRRMDGYSDRGLHFAAFIMMKNLVIGLLLTDQPVVSEVVKVRQKPLTLSARNFLHFFQFILVRCYYLMSYITGLDSIPRLRFRALHSHLFLPGRGYNQWIENSASARATDFHHGRCSAHGVFS